MGKGLWVPFCTNKEFVWTFSVADHRVKLVTSVPVRWKFHPGYMHTFAMTPHYFIIVEQPLSISVPRLIKNSVTNRPLATCLKFFEKQSVSLEVLGRGFDSH